MKAWEKVGKVGLIVALAWFVYLAGAGNAAVAIPILLSCMVVGMGVGLWIGLDQTGL